MPLNNPILNFLFGVSCGHISLFKLQRVQICLDLEACAHNTHFEPIKWALSAEVSHG